MLGVAAAETLRDGLDDLTLSRTLAEINSDEVWFPDLSSLRRGEILDEASQILHVDGGQAVASSINHWEGGKVWVE